MLSSGLRPTSQTVSKEARESMLFGSEIVVQLLTSGWILIVLAICFWIRSSARRAFGECLGSKRR